MENDQIEKSLKSSFVGAANHLTQLYTTSTQLQKQAYVQVCTKLLPSIHFVS